MTKGYQITIDGESFLGQYGETVLDAALRNGVDLAHDCRAGHCGTCCVRLVSGGVKGGEGAEAGIIHACQSRVVADAVIERGSASVARTVAGTVELVRTLTPEISEVAIRTERVLPNRPGQYAQVCFGGYPSRPFSITHPIDSGAPVGLLWFHIRRMATGRVTRELGNRIVPGHTVSVSGPYGSAYFRAGQTNRMLLVATSTGFAPIWSIAVAALHENPERAIMVIAGGRSLDSLYMVPALARLARFRNVRVLPVCSAPERRVDWVHAGRPTDFLPELVAQDVVYACGAPGLVEEIKSFAASVGAACHADPFMPATEVGRVAGVLSRTLSSWRSAAPRTGWRPESMTREPHVSRVHAGALRLPEPM